MNPIILYRAYDFEFEPEELVAMKKYFRVTPNRTTLQKGDLVIGRLSLLPYYREVVEDLKILGATLINTHIEHSYIADMQHWYYDLEGLTPKTWFEPSRVTEEGPYVLKGHTNSRKSLWRTHMYAPSRKDIGIVLCHLLDDTFISQQQIYVRKYVPLKTYLIGLNGQPITDEYRFFICYGKIISGAYYWSSHIEDLNEQGIFPDVERVPRSFIREVMDRVGDHAKFYVIDVAQTAEGEWIVVELNDGCQSGLSENSPDTLFRNLKEAIAGHLGLPDGP